MISVIIPTYNRRELLEQTINSLRASHSHEFEIVVVDDGSNDGTQAYLDKQSDIRWLQQENSGPSVARNRGVEMARGEYLAFLDSDDLWFPWTLQTYMDVIEKTNASFIAGKPFLFEEEAPVFSTEAEQLQFEEFKDYLDSGDQWRWWGCSSFVMRKVDFLEAGGFCKQWVNGEDADMALRMGTAQGFVQITQPYTFAYRQHAASEMKDTPKTFHGAEFLLDNQMSGKYPGQKIRAKEQWRILSRHLRPVALAALQGGNRSLAWKVYKACLPWHLRQGRWKFILGFLWRACR